MVKCHVKSCQTICVNRPILDRVTVKFQFKMSRSRAGFQIEAVSLNFVLRNSKVYRVQIYVVYSLSGFGVEVQGTEQKSVDERRCRQK